MKKWLWGIIVLAIILRFWQLGGIPSGFHADEAAYGYNAYSILRTGRDEYGARFPLVLKSFGDYKAAVDSYLAIPFIWAGGLHEWTIRAPSAVFGILYIILTYLLILRLSGNKRLSMVGAALAAVSPSGILLSRVQSDPLICITFFYAAFYSWLVWLDTKKVRYIILFVLFVGLSFFTYTVTRLFAVPFFLLYAATYWKQFGKGSRMLFLALCAAVLLAVGALYISPAGVWFSQVNIFSTKGVQLPLNEEITEDGAQHAPLLLTRIVHNKVVAYGRFLTKNFADYLSFDFLFFQSEQPLREQIPNTGVLFIVDAPFLLAGVYFAIRKKLRFGIFAILWTALVAAVLSLAVAESPNVHRFFLAMIPMELLTALGITFLSDIVTRRYKRIFVVVIMCLYVANLFYFMHELFVHQPVHAPIYRNDEYTRLAKEMKRLYGSYDIIVSPRILEHILFYFPVDPAAYQSMGSPRDTINGRFDKFLFTADPCPKKLTESKTILYVDNAQCPLLPGDILVSTVRFGNSLPAYYLVEKKE